MEAFIEPPKRIPWYLRIGIWFSERVAGKVLLPARLLAWYPKAALGSGVPPPGFSGQCELPARS